MIGEYWIPGACRAWNFIRICNNKSLWIPGTHSSRFMSLRCAHRESREIIIGGLLARCQRLIIHQENCFSRSHKSRDLSRSFDFSSSVHLHNSANSIGRSSYTEIRDAGWLVKLLVIDCFWRYVLFIEIRRESGTLSRFISSQAFRKVNEILRIVSRMVNDCW